VLDFLRQSLKADVRSIEEIATATGIDADDLRRFRNGLVPPEPLDLERLAYCLGLDLVRRSTTNLLPLEREVSERIQRTFEQAFADAATVMALAFKVIGTNPDGRGALGNISKPRGLTWPVVNLCLGLYTKIIKHFRAVIALSEVGLAEDANVAARAMFEATLALHFILIPRTPLNEDGCAVTHSSNRKELLCPKCKHVVRAAKVGKPLRKLSTVMRAKLYVAFTVIQEERRHKEYVREGINSPEVSARLPKLQKAARKAKTMIGAGWADRQETSRGFAGVKIRHLADSYGLLEYYLTVYRYQSDIVHGTNALEYLDIEAFDDSLRLNLSPNPNGIDTVLFTATTFMAGAADVLNRRLGLGFGQPVKEAMKHLLSRGRAL
jgi:hypothetical protein